MWLRGEGSTSSLQKSLESLGKKGSWDPGENGSPKMRPALLEMGTESVTWTPQQDDPSREGLLLSTSRVSCWDSYHPVLGYCPGLGFLKNGPETRVQGLEVY